MKLPEGFTTITANMFGDIQVREIYIPASVTKIEEGAFGAQIYLTSIRVSFNNSKYRSQNGVLYNKKMVLYNKEVDHGFLFWERGDIIPSETSR